MRPSPIFLIGLLLTSACLLLQPVASQESCERFKILGENGNVACGCPPGSMGGTVKFPGSPNRSRMNYINDIVPRSIAATTSGIQQLILPKKLTYELWPGGIIFYTIDKSYSKVHQKLISDTIAKVEEMVGSNHIEFKEAIAKDGDVCRKNFVRIHPGTKDMCEANVGMNKEGPTILNLGPRCMEEQVVLHELLHTLGLKHEQNRPMRDEHVTINFDKIFTPLCMNYRRDETEDLISGVPYDIHSIMQYGSCLGTCDGSPIIFNKEDGKTFDMVTKMSAGDVRKLRVLYPAKQKVQYSDRLCRGKDEPEDDIVVVVRRGSNDTGTGSSRGTRPWGLTALLLVAAAAMGLVPALWSDV